MVTDVKPHYPHHGSVAHSRREAARAQVERGLFDLRAGLLPSQLKETERQLAIDTYAGLVLGNLAGLAVAEGMDNEQIESELQERVRQSGYTVLSSPRTLARESRRVMRRRAHHRDVVPLRA